MPSRRSFLASAAAVAAVPASAPAAPGPDAVSIALMGCGGMGTNHLRLLAANPRVRITHVCDADANRLAAAAKIAARPKSPKPRAERKPLAPKPLFEARHDA
ncbi:MAG: hypothetical protein J0H99_26865 [Rhodospirillales bacterium]|nr:hypothetical protein [Rhodospirillales bacterium]